uniref:NADH-ubiquinone oxidoreductase chain 4 n=1 Tax=Sipunculus nudus TaxID=6446 RepID=A0A0U1WMA0_SIPNU|nr:NADH dehydrogenase subunit 4 [Sipunculus nudus]AWK60885.1 NADH dehydrogenase subunit 4 [Sipunculus nudus]
MMKLIFFSASLLLLPKTPKKWYITSAMILLCATTCTLLLYSPHFSPQLISSNLFTDSLSAPLITLTLWISGLMILASQKVKTKKDNYFTLITTILLLNLTLVLSFSMSHFILFYIFFEASLIPTLILILLWGYQPERLQAGTYLMMYTVTASLPLLINLLIISHNSGHLDLTFHAWVGPQLYSAPLLTAWWASCLAAFLVKLPMFTTHLWLPKAHVEAPVAGSMILAGLLLKLGSYGLLRLCEKFPPTLTASTSSFLLPLTIWGAISTSLICLRQPDLKSLIAYSSVGHMGLLLAGLMSNSTWGWQGSLAMSIAHGLCSSGLFALANMTYESTHTRSLFLTKGLQTLFPTMTLWWFIFSASNMAAPPTINLLSEILLLTSVVAISYTMIFPLMLISFFAAAYSLTLFTATQHGPLTTASNPYEVGQPKNYLILLAHMLPIGTLILKPEVITLWI